jgi:hypothetical protein
MAASTPLPATSMNSLPQSTLLPDQSISSQPLSSQPLSGSSSITVNNLIYKNGTLIGDIGVDGVYYSFDGSNALPTLRKKGILFGYKSGGGSTQRRRRRKGSFSDLLEELTKQPK